MAAQFLEKNCRCVDKLQLSLKASEAVWMVVAKPKDRILPIEIKPSDVAVGSVSDLDPDWIQIQLGQWIRKRIRNPDPDPGRQKFHVLK
jgi:hypothetical protein